ncbi:aspartic proteinase nepenthesin-1-like [Prunus yedoensis var. nudiflora]|uniref:Aspartic proteinase nepenthesin-1-like n=1 Tax=Prunus yedoensis var. nudiflora TaxID=2094558 RepID=A0A314ZL37_PRUYE|nr:aspartic proteinase nepenthesin-1-like [Prunus yedoensis var. nudiflora]
MLVMTLNKEWFHLLQLAVLPSDHDLARGCSRLEPAAPVLNFSTRHKKVLILHGAPEQRGIGKQDLFWIRGSDLWWANSISGGEDRYYYVTLIGIHIGDQNVPLPDGIFNMTSDGEGGFMIDSGTTYTFLRSEAYDALIRALSEAIDLPQRRGPSEWFEL